MRLRNKIIGRSVTHNVTNRARRLPVKHTPNKIKMTWWVFCFNGKLYVIPKWEVDDPYGLSQNPCMSLSPGVFVIIIL